MRIQDFQFVGILLYNKEEKKYYAITEEQVGDNAFEFLQKDVGFIYSLLENSSALAKNNCILSNFFETFIEKQKYKISKKIKWKVFKRDNFRCCYCGRDDLPLSYDHYIPRSEGGLTNIENGRTACLNCNNIKYNSDPFALQWEEERKKS